METVTTSSNFQIHLDLATLAEFQERLVAEAVRAKRVRLPSLMYAIEAQADWFDPKQPELGIYPLRLLAWMQRMMESHDLRTMGLELQSRYTVTNPETGRLVPWTLSATWKPVAQDSYPLANPATRVVLQRENRTVILTPSTLTVFSADKTADLEKWVYSYTPEGKKVWHNEFKREHRENPLSCPPTRHAASQKLHRIIANGGGQDWKEGYQRYWRNTLVIQENREKSAKADQALMIAEAVKFFEQPWTQSSLMRFVHELQQRENALGVRYVQYPFIKVIEGVEHVIADRPSADDDAKEPQAPDVLPGEATALIDLDESRDKSIPFSRVYVPLMD